MPGKISRLPHEIRERLNQRLADGHSATAVLPWLNSLPEVQAVLTAQFAGEPISDNNLSEYRKRGFRKWQTQRAALEFSSEPPPNDSAQNQLAMAPLLENLARWSCVRLAAAAESLPAPEQPEAELRDIRSFINDIVALRRGDLVSRRISLEELRLAAAQAKSDKEMEALFWTWTKRPDIQSKLYPHRDPDKVRRDVVRMLDRELLGRTHHDDEPEPDPGCYI
jgi:hypothetical protein